MLLTAVVLSLVYLLEAYRDILPDKIAWENSVVGELPNLLSTELCWAASILLSLLASILLSITNSRHFPMKAGADMLLWFWTIQIAAFPFLHTLTEAHFATLFVLLSHITLFTLEHKSCRNYEKLFLSAMYLGIATIFYTHIAILLVPHIIATFRLKHAEYRNCLISLFGFLTPFYFASIIFFFTNGNWLYPFETTLNSLIFQLPTNPVDFTSTQWTFGIFVMTMILIKWFVIPQYTGGMSQKTISFNQIFSSMLILSLLIFFVYAPSGKLMLPVIFIYTTSFLRIMFVMINKRFIAALMIISIAALSLVHFFIQ